MPPIIALAICLIGTLYILWYDNIKYPEISKAIWIPILWLMIISSRPASAWLNLGDPYAAFTTIEEGSPIDRAIFIFLMLCGIFIILRRNISISSLITSNFWIAILFLYCGLSILWSDFPFIALKRYIKGIGVLIMALVVISERNPFESCQAVIRRTAYIFMPLSIVFIKYYRHLGVGYSPWGEGPYFMGVGGNKNTLGRICLFAAFYFVWKLIVDKNFKLDRTVIKEKWIHIIYLIMTILLLLKSDSKTSLVCVFISACVFFLLRTNFISNNISIFFPLSFIAILSVIFLEYTLGFASFIVTDILGRDLTLTNRLYLWEDVLSLATSPIIGAGFESFWLGDRLLELWDKYWWKPNMAHNGYIEIYIELGILGLLFWMAVLYASYRHSMYLFSQNKADGIFRLTFIVTTLFYNFTEAGYALTSTMWFVFLIIELRYNTHNSKN